MVIKTTKAPTTEIASPVLKTGEFVSLVGSADRARWLDAAFTADLPFCFQPRCLDCRLRYSVYLHERVSVNMCLALFVLDKFG